MLGSRRGAPAAPVERPAGRLWDPFADVLLQRAALLARVHRNRGPDPLAGLKVDDADLEALLSELPGLESGDSEQAAKIEALLAKPVADARQLLAELLEADNDLAHVVGSAALDPLEAEVLALLCAVEADPRRQRLVGYLNDDVTVRHLTLWSLETVFGRSEQLVRAVAPGGGLRRAALLQPPAEAPWSAAPIVVAAPVMWWLSGHRFLDPEVPAGTEVLAAPGTGTSWLVVAAGLDRRRRLQAALDALAAGSALVAPLPADRAGWDALVRMATLAGCAVVLEVDDALPPDAREHVERAGHLAWAVTSTSELPLGSLFRNGWTEVEVGPSPATPEEWAAAFPSDDADGTDGASGGAASAPGGAGGTDRAGGAASASYSTAASAYRLTAQQLHDVRQAVQAGAADLTAAIRRLAAGNIETTAVRIRPKRTWDDLVLEESRLAQVREIAVRHHQRHTVYERWGFSPQPSTGVVALFAGPSGTGKTLAAEIVAGDLGVDLYKIDLSNLVSKYIGETEKNLSRVFEAAEASRVVLFFDEADALLGKRSEVSDAHDRYANIEVAYLLQRLEAYEGVAVMATNMVNNLDPAFMRRLHIVVDFPLPQAPERRRIWARSIPPGAPVAEDLDLDRLAEQIEVSGGTIRNVVLRAAFLAAEASTPITMETMLVALQREFEKLGRLTSSSEWRRIFEHLTTR